MTKKTVYRTINPNRKTNRYRVKFKKNKTDQIPFDVLEIVCSYKSEKRTYNISSKDLPSYTDSIHFNVTLNNSSFKIEWDKNIAAKVKLVKTER
ncbi:MAG: hypothetical protein LKG50_03680 [Prevotella sp.]|jgi:hypothetical protein|nr:hypothetical protein [Prevotella sp.]MCH4016857.1 hypothetical protein [Prevotella sp.]MCI1291457.1 hypothetical protein [Prevotella sp.]MCI1323737.1 hypothetical protein [Prevotella sp.]MCI1348946.1 hypothetical protein [Prevotella sp.]MCI1450031.1 hypothetical protein [Prevotella sp.]